MQIAPLNARRWFGMDKTQAVARTIAHRSLFRPGGFAYSELPIDSVSVPAAGLGGAGSIDRRQRALRARFHARPMFVDRAARPLLGLGDYEALGGVIPGCEWALRRAAVAMGLRYAGAKPSTALYYDAVMPHDTPSFQANNGIPFGEGGLSSCAMYMRSTLDRLGLVDARFNGPYEARVSYAISDILNLARENGAYVDWGNGEGVPPPKPGDILHIGGLTDNGFEHMGMLTGIESDGTTWHTVDGGQPGVEERVRHIVGGQFQADGRNLNGYVDISKLPLPCPVGNVFVSGLALFVALAAGMYAVREGSRYAARYI